MKQSESQMTGGNECIFKLKLMNCPYKKFLLLSSMMKEKWNKYFFKQHLMKQLLLL